VISKGANVTVEHEVGTPIPVERMYSYGVSLYSISNCSSFIFPVNLNDKTGALSNPTQFSLTPILSLRDYAIAIGAVNIVVPVSMTIEQSSSLHASITSPFN
jgi:hypothetical protein